MKLIMYISLFIPYIVMATTYNSLTEGSWSNTTNVWSTDGITPCLCTPGSSVDSDTVIIEHTITFGSHLTFENLTYVEITSNGRFEGPNKDISIESAEMNARGNSVFRKLTVDASSSLIMISSYMTLSNSLNLYGNIVLNDSYLTTQLTNIHTSGVLDLINASKLLAQSGTVTNEGIVNIDADCCFEINSGNFKNETTGSVLGTGAVLGNTGNITNDNIWDVNVKWCTDGSGFGMPNAEDCSGVSDICMVIVLLPIELLSFEGQSAPGYNELFWTTLSELNNDYFVIERSVDGLIWTLVETIQGAGNSTERIDYIHRDASIENNSTYYYRLVQYDFDGQYSVSNVISLKTTKLDDFTIYPNPSKDRFIVVDKDQNISNVLIYDVTGALVYNYENKYNQPIIEIVHDLKNGVYTIHVQAAASIRSRKLIVNQ